MGYLEPKKIYLCLLVFSPSYVIYLSEEGGLLPKFSKHFLKQLFTVCCVDLAWLNSISERHMSFLVGWKPGCFDLCLKPWPCQTIPEPDYVTGGWIIHWKLLIAWETASDRAKRLSGVICELFTRDCRITQGPTGLKWITDTASARPEGAAINALITQQPLEPRVLTQGI